MNVVFVITGNANGTNHAAGPDDLRGRRGRLRRPDPVGRRRRRLRDLERGGRDRLLGRRRRRGALRRHPQGRLPRDQAVRPGRQGPARAAHRQQLQLPRAGLRRRRRRLLRRGRGPHRQRLPRRSAELLLPRGRQRRALHLPGLPHRPRRDDRQRRRRQADLDDRAGVDEHDVDLHARHVGGPEALGRHRGRAGRQPQGGLPLPRRLPLRRDRPVVHPQGHDRATRTSSTTTACSAPTARTSPRGTPSTRSPRRATSSAGRAATSTRRR